MTLHKQFVDARSDIFNKIHGPIFHGCVSNFPENMRYNLKRFVCFKVSSPINNIRDLLKGKLQSYDYDFN